jgi:hypothetical protein
MGRWSDWSGCYAGGSGFGAIEGVGAGEATGTREGVRNDAGAVPEGLAASGGGEGERCVSDSVTVAGSLEFVGSVDAVSEVEGAKG